MTEYRVTSNIKENEYLPKDIHAEFRVSGIMDHELKITSGRKDTNTAFGLMVLELTKQLSFVLFPQYSFRIDVLNRDRGMYYYGNYDDFLMRVTIFDVPALTQSVVMESLNRALGESRYSMTKGA